MPPHIVHPVSAAMRLLEMVRDEGTVAAGFLHDVVEDGFQGWTRDLVAGRIRWRLGERALALDKMITEFKEPNITPDEKKRIWRQRKQVHLRNLRATAPQTEKKKTRKPD